jgi:hypothetical protein
MFSSTDLESCKWKQTYFGIMQRLLATRAEVYRASLCFLQKRPHPQCSLEESLNTSSSTMVCWPRITYWNLMSEIQRFDDGDKIMVLLDTMGRKVPTLIRPEDVQEIHTKSREIISKADPRMCKLA